MDGHVADEAPTPAPHDLRLDETRSGRRLISTFIAVALACWGVAVLPVSIAAPPSVRDVTDSFIRTTGTYQDWSVFSPPRRTVLALEARVEFDDGSTATWHLPRSNDVVGSYFDYHWHKYMEHVVPVDGNDGWVRLREPLARFVARQMRRDGHRVVEVTLIGRRTVNLPLEGDGPTQSDTTVDEFYTLDLQPKADDA